MKKLNLNKNLIVYILVIGLLIFIFIFLITTNIIGYSVKNNCQNAQAKYEGDCVTALISLLNDESNDYRSRNSAIWALGQLGDERALPHLKKLYTNNIPEKESLSKTISQYELKKAINLTSGGFNASQVFWQSMIK